MGEGSSVSTSRELSVAVLRNVLTALMDVLDNPANVVLASAASKDAGIAQQLAREVLAVAIDPSIEAQLEVPATSIGRLVDLVDRVSAAQLLSGYELLLGAQIQLRGPGQVEVEVCDDSTSQTIGATLDLPNDRVVEAMMSLGVTPAIDAALKGRGPASRLLSLRVLEIGFGSGEILEQTAASLSKAAERCDPKGFSEQGDLDPIAAVTRCITGIETDPVLVALCRRRLSEAIPGTDLASWDIRFVDGATPADIVAGLPLNAFDVVLGSQRCDDSEVLVPTPLIERMRAEGSRLVIVRPETAIGAYESRSVSSLEEMGAEPEAFVSIDSFAEEHSCLVVIKRGTPAALSSPPGAISAGRQSSDSLGPDLRARAASLAFPRCNRRLGDLSRVFREDEELSAALESAVSPQPSNWRLVASREVEPLRLHSPANEAEAAQWVNKSELSRFAAPAAWARTRSVPKILVADRTRVTCCVVDELGAMLGAPGMLTVIPDDGNLWAIAGLLSSPAISALLIQRSPESINGQRLLKLDGHLLRSLPVPADSTDLSAVANAARIAASVADDDRVDALLAVADEAHTALGIDDQTARQCTDWWLKRLIIRAPRQTALQPRA